MVSVNDGAFARSRRASVDASSEKLFRALLGAIVFPLLGLKFYGEGGLMADSRPAREDSADGKFPIHQDPQPFGDGLVSQVRRVLSLHQELFECSMGPRGLVAAIRMTVLSAPARIPGTSPSAGSHSRYVERL